MHGPVAAATQITRGAARHAPRILPLHGAGSPVNLTCSLCQTPGLWAAPCHVPCMRELSSTAHLQP